MRALFHTLVARMRDFLRPGAGEADFNEELDAHLAMAEEDKVRRGLSREQARREARLELGGVAQLREAARAARGLPWLETFWLDGKLGLRMLRRSWGLTLVGGLAMAVTIGLGASIFNIWDTFAGTRLPLDEGDRIVAIQPFDKAAQRVGRTPLADFRRWRETLTSVEHVSAMRTIDPAVIARGGAIGSVPAAEMTASGFRLARVEPLLGRPLMDEDEREGAEPVAVIGYQLWQSGFSSDPAVLGQRIQIGDTPHIVVGVMPGGFRFPVNQRLWTPLRTDPIGQERPGADAFVFARLVPGATPERAQAEVATVGLLPQETAAGTTARLEPRVVPYAAGIFPDVHSNSWLAAGIFLLGALLLIPPCANIAILVYARTITRRDEFAARTALGASRGRIVMQLFVEVLVLAAVAGIAGLLLAREFSGRLAGIVMPTMGSLPFWMDFTPSLATVVCAAGLSALAAAIAGAVPAFRVTGRWRRTGVFGLDNRGAEPGLGKTWTALLATQVALSLAILPSAIEMMWGTFRPSIVAMTAGPGLPLEEFLTASLVMEGDTSRFDTLRIEAVRRLTSEPGISGVTASAARLLVEPSARIEVEGREGQGVEAQFNSVDDRYFEVFDVRLLAGRSFDASDFGPGRTPVIVNRSFVTNLIGDPPSPGLRRTGANALGRRIRYHDKERLVQSAQREGGPVRRSAQREGGWHEIVGIVEDFPVSNNDPTMFHPMTRAPHPLNLTVRAPSGIGVAADRLREVASGLDPRLRAGRLRSLDEMFWQRRSFDDTFGLMVSAGTAIVLLLSMAGMYSLMAFIVAQRWREIGVRTALGAQPRRLLIGIFGRAAVPLLIGAMAGCALALLVHASLPIAEVGGRSIPGIVPASAALMIVAGLLAVAGPARRAIRIDPTEALRIG
jgi:putative ABC transport system permease protein